MACPYELVQTSVIVQTLGIADAAELAHGLMAFSPAIIMQEPSL